MQTKTLGGDRLGAGKKMKVTLHGYERSTHDMGYLWRSTMAAGTLVPFLCEVALPGDTFDINLGCDVKTHPTIGPLFGSYKVQLDVFQAPIRLYQAFLHNNALNIGRQMSQIKLPQARFTVFKLSALTVVNDLDNLQINPSSIMSYLGLRGFGMNTTSTEPTAERQFQVVPLLAYWEIYKNYYANKQEEIGAVIHTQVPATVTSVMDIAVRYPSTSAGVSISTTIEGAKVIGTGGTFTIQYNVGFPPIPNTIMIKTLEKGWIPLGQFTNIWSDDTVGGFLRGTYDGNLGGELTIQLWRYINSADPFEEQPTVETFPLDNIDKMRMELLKHDISTAVLNDMTEYIPYSHVYGWAGTRNNLQQSQEGLAVKTYQSDLFNNWISTEWIDGAGGITEVTSIDTSGGSFTLDTLNLSRKVYNMLNRIAVSGGTYDDWLDVVYTNERYQRAESPIYHGGLIKELVFQEVVSNTESASGEPLGTLAGKGVLAKKHKGGQVRIKVDEPSYILGIVSLTPRLDYSQGNKWDVHLQTIDDLHKPALDEIGFQELITEQMAWWDTQYNNVDDTWTQRSAGKQPAWINYMTNVNQTRGNFAIANNEMFMTLNRRYEALGAFPSQITDLTTYIDPSKFNFIFAQTALDAQNFWTQISVDMTVRRKMSAKIMPNL